MSPRKECRERLGLGRRWKRRIKIGRMTERKGGVTARDCGNEKAEKVICRSYQKHRGGHQVAMISFGRKR